jgi:hypothetical protein
MPLKRAPGAGRKPKGDTAMPSFTWRMPADVRSQLEAAAKKNGLNLSDELLRRLRASFVVEHERRRDPAIKALTFLISTATQWVSLAPPGARLNWYRNRFLYRAFQTATQIILAALEPPGEIILPDEEPFASMDARGRSRMLEKYKTPESAGESAANLVLRELFWGAPSETDVPRPVTERRISPEVADFVSWVSYNMSNARRDLGIKLEGPKS